MPRQNITIKSRAGNRRIQAAIPVFMNRFGWPKVQATAVAIRLESVGRLHDDGLISRSEKVFGAAGLALAALAATPALDRRRVSPDWERVTGRYKRFRTAQRLKKLQ